MPTVVSAGNGPTRDALIAFKVPGALVSAAAPDALVIEETGPSMAAWYTPGPNRGMASYGTLVDLARQTAAADGAEVGRVFLVGHSEGGEAVRTHLIEGADPEGVVIADGTYSAFNTPEHIDVWRRYIDRAKSCGRIAVFSHASLPASLGLSPQATLEAATGWKMPTGDTVEELAVQRDGCLAVHSWGGRDGVAHMHQRDPVLGQMIAEARGMSGGYGAVRYVALGVGLIAGVALGAGLAAYVGD